jgi:hypothetical protein
VRVGIWFISVTVIDISAVITVQLCKHLPNLREHRKKIHTNIFQDVVVAAAANVLLLAHWQYSLCHQADRPENPNWYEHSSLGLQGCDTV